MRKYLYLILILIFSFNFSCKEESSIYLSSTYEEQTNYDYVVEIKGAVRIPGIYYVSNNSLLQDVIRISGGLLVDADISQINLVSPIVNNQMIYIPYKSNITNSLEQPKININVASKDDLMKLKGIGESKASAIIEYRNNNGLFIIIEDIMKVSGIGEEVFNKIKTDITVS